MSNPFYKTSEPILIPGQPQPRLSEIAQWFKSMGVFSKWLALTPKAKEQLEWLDSTDVCNKEILNWNVKQYAFYNTSRSEFETYLDRLHNTYFPKMDTSM
jgi:hypothetical protein